MATIKTQVVNGVTRILTKITDGVRRVSCSCCAAEEGCCMYPADQVGVLFGSDDLPDEVYLFVSVGEVVLFDGNLTKNGSSYESGTVTLSIEDNLIWRLSNSEDSRFAYGRRCLFNEAFPYDPQSDEMGFTVSIQDTFSDTYTLSNGTSSFVVARTGLCTWEGEGGSLYYTGGGFDAAGQGTFEWRSTFFEENGPKQSGNQNTPAGTYQDPNSLGTWTVSE